MMELKHTEGPWIFEDNGVGSFDDTFYVYDHVNQKVISDQIVNKDDARLISAAPEMLEYLIKSSIESIEMWKDTLEDYDKEFSFEEWKEANIKKVNIIEKSTGQKIEDLIK